MAGYGWSYLTVTHEPGGAAPSFFTATEGAPPPPRAFRASDQSAFTSEEEMFGELGVTGWELVTVRESAGRLTYYFKRPRA